MLLIPLLFAEMPSLFFFFLFIHWQCIQVWIWVHWYQCCSVVSLYLGKTNHPTKQTEKKKKCPFQSSVNTTVCLNWSDQCAEIWWWNNFWQCMLFWFLASHGISSSKLFYVSIFIIGVSVCVWELVLLLPVIHWLKCFSCIVYGFSGTIRLCLCGSVWVLGFFLLVL